MSDCRFGVSPVNYPDPDPDENESRFTEIEFFGPPIEELTAC